MARKEVDEETMNAGQEDESLETPEDFSDDALMNLPTLLFQEEELSIKAGANKEADRDVKPDSQKVIDGLMQSSDYRDRAAGRAINAMRTKEPELADRLVDMVTNGEKSRAVTLGFAIDSFEGKDFGTDDAERASDKKGFATDAIKEFLKTDEKKAELFADLAGRPFCSISGCQAIKSMLKEDNVQGLNILRDCLNSPVPNDPRPLPDKPVNYFESGKQLLRLFDSYYHNDMKTLLSNVSEKGQIENSINKMFYGNRDAYDLMMKGLKSGDEKDRQISMRLADLPANAQGRKDLETLTSSLREGKISEAEFKTIITGAKNNEQVGQLIRLRADSSMKNAGNEIFKKLATESGQKEVQQILDWQTSKFDQERKSGQLAMNLLNSPDEKTRALPFEVAKKVEDMGFRSRLLELAQNPKMRDGVKELSNLAGSGVKDRQIFADLNRLLDSETPLRKATGEALLEKLAGSDKEKGDARNILLNVRNPSSQAEMISLLASKHAAAPKVMEMLSGNADNKHAANQLLDMRAHGSSSVSEKLLNGLRGDQASEGQRRLISLSKLSDYYKMEKAFKLWEDNPSHKAGMEKLIESLNEGPEQVKAAESLLSNLYGTKLPTDGKLWTNDRYADSEKVAAHLIAMLGRPQETERAKLIIKHGEDQWQRDALLKLSYDHEPSANRLLSMLKSPDHNDYGLARSIVNSYGGSQFSGQESHHSLKHVRTLFDIMDASEGKGNADTRFPSDNGRTAAILKAGLDQNPTTGTVHLTSILHDRDASKRQAGLDVLKSLGKMDAETATKLLNCSLDSAEKNALSEMLTKTETAAQGKWLLNLAGDKGQYEEGGLIRENGVWGSRSFMKLCTGSGSRYEDEKARDRRQSEFVMDMIKNDPETAESLIRNATKTGMQWEMIKLLQKGSPQEKAGAKNLLKLFETPLQDRARNIMDYVAARSSPAGEGANKLIAMLGGNENEKQKAMDMIAAVRGQVETGNFLRGLNSPNQAFQTWQNLCSAPDKTGKSTAANMARAIFAEGLKERQIAERLVNELSPQNYKSHFKLQPYQYETLNQLAKEKNPAFDSIMRALYSNDEATNLGARQLLRKVADLKYRESEKDQDEKRKAETKEARAELESWMKALSDPAKSGQATQLLSAAENPRLLDEMAKIVNDKEAMEKINMLSLSGKATQETMENLIRSSYDAKEMRGILKLMSCSTKAELDLFKDMKESPDPNKSNAAGFLASLLGSPDPAKNKSGEKLLAAFQDPERIEDLAKLTMIMRADKIGWVEPFTKRENREALRNIVSEFEERSGDADASRNAYFRLQGLDEPDKKAQVMQEIEMLNDSRHLGAGLRMLFKYRLY